MTAQTKIKLLRSPLIGNAISPLEKVIEDDISFDDALDAFKTFSEQHDGLSGFLYHDHTRYRVRDGVVIAKEVSVSGARLFK